MPIAHIHTQTLHQLTAPFSFHLITLKNNNNKKTRHNSSTGIAETWQDIKSRAETLTHSVGAIIRHFQQRGDQRWTVRLLHFHLRTNLEQNRTKDPDTPTFARLAESFKGEKKGGLYATTVKVEMTNLLCSVTGSLFEHTVGTIDLSQQGPLKLGIW